MIVVSLHRVNPRHTLEPYYVSVQRLCAQLHEMYSNPITGTWRTRKLYCTCCYSGDPREGLVWFVFGMHSREATSGAPRTRRAGARLVAWSRDPAHGTPVCSALGGALYSGVRVRPLTRTPEYSALGFWTVARVSG